MSFFSVAGTANCNCHKNKVLDTRFNVKIDAYSIDADIVFYDS